MSDETRRVSYVDGIFGPVILGLDHIPACPLWTIASIDRNAHIIGCTSLSPQNALYLLRSDFSESSREDRTVLFFGN